MFNRDIISFLILTVCGMFGCGDEHEGTLVRMQMQTGKWVYSENSDLEDLPTGKVKKNCAQALFWLHCTQFSDYYMYIRIYARAYAGFFLFFFCSNFFLSRSLNLVHKIYSIRASFRKNFNFFPSLTISYCMSYTTIVVRYRFMGARVYV